MAADRPSLGAGDRSRPAHPISSKRIEAVISRSVAGFGIVFGAQTVAVLLGQLDGVAPAWVIPAVVALFGSVVVALVASALGRFVHQAHALVALVYLLALVTWPLGVTDVYRVPEGNHWLYYLLTLAAATAAVGMPLIAATAYLFATPLLYAGIRLTPPGGGVDPGLVTLDAVYALILGGGVMIIVTMLRQAAHSVDDAQSTALARYTVAVRNHATELERVQVDAIVHDSVLTTLLSAARASDAESKALAADMAARALGHLGEVGSPDGAEQETLTVTGLAERIAEVVRTLPVRMPVTVRHLHDERLPANVGEALYSASVQAVMNSLQHAGDDERLERWVRVRGLTGGGVLVEVGDRGKGFDPAVLPVERLGVRVSIVERVANVGGAADIDSVPGRGTVVSLSWPARPGGRGSGGGTRRRGVRA